MKRLAFACLIVAGTASEVLAATSLDASMFNSAKISASCDNLSSCVGTISLKVKCSHRMSISLLEEAELQSDTTVTLTGFLIFGVPIEFRLGEDPNFQNGDTSAKIKKAIPIPIGLPDTDPAVINISAKISWSDGELAVSATLSLTGPSTTVPFLPRDGKDIGNNDKAVTPVPLTTTFVRPSGPVFSAVAQLIGDIKQAVKIQASTDGSGSQQIAISFKSKGFIPPP